MDSFAVPDNFPFGDIAVRSMQHLARPLHLDLPKIIPRSIRPGNVLLYTSHIMSYDGWRFLNGNESFSPLH
jgi:hypothetical protein